LASHFDIIGAEKLMLKIATYIIEKKY